MKKFTKLFLSCAAVAAVTAAVATSAMAADDVTATYDNDTDVLKVNATYDAAQKTLLILPADIDLTETVDVKKIVQIGQEAEYSNAVIALPSDLADGLYTVYMGGTGIEAVKEANFRKGKAVGEPIKIGDANLDGKVITQDASLVLSSAVGLTDASGQSEVGAIYVTDEGKNIKIGDANLDGKVITQDASLILSYSVGLTDASGQNYAGTTVTAAPVEE